MAFRCGAAAWNLNLECVFYSIDKVSVVVPFAVLQLSNCLVLLIHQFSKVDLRETRLHPGMRHSTTANLRVGLNIISIRFISRHSKVVVSHLRRMVDLLVFCLRSWLLLYWTCH